MNGSPSNSAAGVWASAASCSAENGGIKCPAMLEMTTPARFEEAAENVREEDVAARWGGEEVLLLLPDSLLGSHARSLASVKAGLTVAEVREVLPAVLADVRDWVRKINSLPD